MSTSNYLVQEDKSVFSPLFFPFILLSLFLTQQHDLLATWLEPPLVKNNLHRLANKK
jgi:hypothetical protein